MTSNRPTKGDGAEATNQEKLRTKGQVRIRSNVCTDPEAWHLVPGDVVRHYGLQYGVNKEQHEEMMYYEPCCLCKRAIYWIKENGCDDPVCRKLMQYR
jgi:hypothetical protein